MMEGVALVRINSVQLIIIIMIIIDIDECTEGTHNCTSNGNCENTKGSYICHCGRGYRTPEWDARRCVGKPHHNIIVSIDKYFC